MSRGDAPLADEAEAIAEFLAELPPDSEVLAPIDEIIDTLAHARDLPAVAIGACLLRFDEAAPKLRAVLERAADGERDGDEEELLFRAIHILGGRRDPQSCRPLLRLLRRPVDEVEYLLGDAQTVTLPRIVAGVFDGDVDALFQAIADADIDGFVRWSLFGAATFLTWDGRIDRDRFIRFLEDFDGQRLADPQDAAWCGWEAAIALLGLRDLVPLVERAWAEGRMEPENVEPDFFYAHLARAEAAPDDIARLADQGLGYIEDVVETLQMFPAASDDDIDDEELLEWAAEDFPEDFMPVLTHVNPMRHVGRNDPCPCGSGKKYKKCCLGT